MLTAIFQSIVLKWIFRRILELGGLGGVILAAYGALPPTQQTVIARVLQGDWGEITLSALFPLAMAAGGYIWSFVSTVKPHATAGGVQVATSQMTPTKSAEVKEAVKTTAAKQRPNLADALGDIFRRK